MGAKKRERKPVRAVDPNGQRLSREVERIRIGRSIRPDRISAVGDFLPAQFKRDYERPYRKLGRIMELWQEIVPCDLVEESALASFNRGVLTVQVPDSSVAYDLERTLASGIEQQLRRAFVGGSLRRVRVMVNPDLKNLPS